jgi:hypothetical protein
MSFSYTAGGTSSKDRIRARIGDTNASATVFLQDEEIADFIVTEGSFRSAAIASARALAAKILPLATDKTVGNLRLVWQRRYENLLALARELKAGLALTSIPLAGGMSVSEKVSDAQNDDLVKPVFRREQFDSPLARSTGEPLPFEEKAQ